MYVRYIWIDISIKMYVAKRVRQSLSAQWGNLSACCFLHFSYHCALPQVASWKCMMRRRHRLPQLLRQPATASLSVPQPATVPQPPKALPLLTALLLQGQQQRLLWWATRWRRDLPCQTGPAGVPWCLCVCVMSRLSLYAHLLMHEFELRMEISACSARSTISDWTVIVIININSHCVHPQPEQPPLLHLFPSPALPFTLLPYTLGFPWRQLNLNGCPVPFIPFRFVLFRHIFNLHKCLLRGI